MATKIKIISSDGHIWDTQFDINTTIENVKKTAVEHFYSKATLAEGFKVIFPEGFRSLREAHAIHDEELKDNDVILIVRRRELIFPDVVRDSELRAPTKDQILAATKNLGAIHLQPAEKVSASANTNPSSSKSVNGKPNRDYECAMDETNDFQLDLRKIFISMLTIMSTMHHENPDIDTICKEMKVKLKKRFVNAQNAMPDTPVVLPPAPEVEATLLGIVEGLIEAKKREFRPNQKAYDALKELGFADTEIIDALRGNRNNKDLACEWLLSENHLITDDVVIGLNPSSHLYKSLVENPTVRLGLHNPKTALAFLEILDSSSNASMWLADPDMSPVLAAVFKIYHSEKHEGHAIPE